MLASLLKKLIIISKAGALSIAGLAIIVLMGTLFNKLAYRSFRPFILPIPSADQIGQEYLQDVIDKKHDKICDDSLINQFGGAATRNVSVRAEWLSGNSDHEFEVITIQFEYHHQTNQLWQKGEIYLGTVSNLESGNSFKASLPFRRYICGLVILV